VVPAGDGDPPPSSFQLGDIFFAKPFPERHLPIIVDKAIVDGLAAGNPSSRKAPGRVGMISRADDYLRPTGNTPFEIDHVGAKCLLQGLDEVA